MSIHHDILTHINPVLRIVKRVTDFVKIQNSNSLRVLIFHDIPPHQEKAFENQIHWLKMRWNIITPETFELMLSGSIPVIGNNLLITFDDGLKSNRIIAEKVLNPMGIKAIFFIISDFVSIKDKDESHKFIADYIMPNSDILSVPGNWSNMGWDDLEALLDQGHTIGGHTKTHKRLSDCTYSSELEDEIINSAVNIENRLGIDLNHFAYTFGNIQSFSELALLKAEEKFSYIYSGIRGDNCNLDAHPFVIRRDAAAYQLSNNEYILFKDKLLESFLMGFADFHYSSDRRKIDLWNSKDK